jgi:hypothetical protein
MLFCLKNLFRTYSKKEGDPYTLLKKVSGFPVPQSLVSDIPAGDGKTANLFNSVKGREKPYPKINLRAP